MKKIIIAALFTSLFATSVYSETFTYGKLTGSFADGKVEVYGTVYEDGEINSLGVDATVYEKQFTNFDLTGRVGFETSVYQPISYVYGEVELSKELKDFEVYGVANVKYYGLDGYFNYGQLVYTPSLGVRKDFTEKFSGYSEISYVYNEDFKPVYGTAEVGLAYDVTEKISFEPSVIKYFDGLDGTTVQLEAKYKF